MPERAARDVKVDLQRNSTFVRGAGAAAVVALIAYAIWPAANSSFSIAATTDVISVEPSCGDKLTWDLPPGWVIGDNASPDAADPLAAAAAPVSVELAAGARVTVVREAAGIWKMRFTQDSAYVNCRPAPPAALIVTVDGKQLPADTDGYFYQSSHGEDPAQTAADAVDASHPLLGPAPPLALRVAGRMTIGQALGEGGGWGQANQPILLSARVEVRDKAWFTHQSLSVLVEEVSSGSIVDTHGCMAEETIGDGPRCINERSGVSAGFVYYPASDGTMFVQIQRTTSRIGVVPFGGTERDLGVTNWATWVKMPIVQSVVAAVLLISALLQGWVAWQEFLARRLRRLGAGPPDFDDSSLRPDDHET